MLLPPANYLEGRPVVGATSSRKRPGALVALLDRLGGGRISIIALVVYGAPAIGEYVVVAQMLEEFGVCSLNQF